jgi:hypothetical protein
MLEATARVVDSLLAQQYEFRTLCDVLDDPWASYGVTPQRKD